MDTQTEFQRVWVRYNELLKLGNDAEASAYVMQEFPNLLQDTRDQIIGEMLTIAMEDKVAERDALTELNEEGITAFEALSEIEKQNGIGTDAQS